MKLHLWFAFLAVVAVGNSASLATETFDHNHAVFDRVLKQHVREGTVSYAALKADPAPLAAYLDQLAGVSRSDFDVWAEPQRLAFLINLYNATTLKLIVDHYPVKSIRSIGWVPGSAWKQDTVRAFGRTFPLDELEHGIIRQEYHDARVHFALVCAARGCPPLRAEAFVGSRLDEQLTEQGRAFFRQTTKNRVESTGHVVQLSPIFKWFHEDFETQAGSILKFIEPFWPEQARQTLASGGEFEIRYTDYDWSLNDRVTVGK